MSTENSPGPEAIRRAPGQSQDARARPREPARHFRGRTGRGLLCLGTTRIRADVETLLNGLEAVGEVMALTRNENAVHEKIGVYPREKVFTGGHSALVLGSDIDLRIFPKAWAHGFAVEKQDDQGIRRSLQFFDAAGEAVHKVHLRPKSNLYAFQKLVEDMAAADQSQTVMPKPLEDEAPKETAGSAHAAPELRERWSAMTDVHQLFGMLRDLKLTRRQAVHMIGEDYAWPLDLDAVPAMMNHAVGEEIPIMCFVGNSGCIQIHSGPIAAVKPMGPWINVMDPTFHLHLRRDRLDEVWCVRKPTKDGHVTSLEAYGVDGEMIIQFFGQRHEGARERADWRFLAENLPRVPRSLAVA